MSLPDINSTDFLITEFFGSGASNPTYINLPIPVASQIGIEINAASFTDGFPPATMTPETSGGLPFFGQDMNGILAMVSANCATLAAGAIPPFSSARASALGGYPASAIVANVNNYGYWINTVANNSNNPDTSAAASSGWQPLAVVGEQVVTLSSGTVTLTAAQAAAPVIAFNGTLTGNVIVNFPPWAGVSWTVAAYTAGSFTITLQTAAAGNQVSLIAGSGYNNAVNVFSDGTNLYSNNVSTAGLAPIASPVFTGTPQGPTAAATSNTTQLATTAMVQAAITSALSLYARLASPIFSGTPSVPTATPGTNTTQAASTAFVQAAVGAVPVIRTGTFTCANGGTAISFSPAFPNACTGLQLTHSNVVNGSNIGFAGYNSLSRTGAVCYASINGMQVNYVATGN